MGDKTKIFDITKLIINPEKNSPTKAEYFNKRLEKINKDKNKKQKEKETKNEKTN